ncbi:MAG: hypothetical protein DA330_05835 [Nitrososphaera sp.]|nr:hypothetical protein [Nitrososphaera sp.]
MQIADFERFMSDSDNKLRGKSDSEKVKIFISWCNKNNIEEVLLRLSSEEKGGWAKNCTLDFTTSRIIVSKKSAITKFADLGFVAGLAPYPYLLTMKNADPTKIRKQANYSPEELAKRENFAFQILFSEIEELIFRKGIETTVTNMFGRAIVSNFLTIKTAGKTYDFRLPVNKDGNYEQIRFWLGVVLPFNMTCY